MPESDVLIEWKTGDQKNDRHMGRYKRCLYEMIRELENLPEAKSILNKYFCSTREDFRVNLDFPDDFDQSLLPEDLR